VRGARGADDARDGVALFQPVVGERPGRPRPHRRRGDGEMWGLAGYPAHLPGNECLFMDHRGHGKSGKPADLEAHRIHH